MFTISELKQTKVYQEALDEGLEQGRLAGEIALLLRQLKYRFGVNAEIEEQLRQLAVPQLEQLGEALFDFREVSDLELWLTDNCSE